jgi:hypothetical protein
MEEAFPKIHISTPAKTYKVYSKRDVGKGGRNGKRQNHKCGRKNI